jgi:hypothetical protein
MEHTTFLTAIDDIRSLFAEKLKANGKTLEQQVAKARRQLPRNVARQAKYLAEAERLIKNPRLARMINIDAVARAHDVVAAHLRSIDPARRRKERLLNFAALVALYVLVAAAVVIGFSWWQGLD